MSSLILVMNISSKIEKGMKLFNWEFFLGLPLPLFSETSTFLLISLLVDACTTFSASLSIVFLFFFVGITVSCGVSSSTSVIFRIEVLFS
ncbi:hypothetical protein BpHYR1_011376 [Brachionus plicatilis]|uniref:Uncharacterized protein n=1 Tax=Brachionus plicatilis TaxID=10195 RepID=A0A3M7T4G5_BRAPC|nr:hypothetical protein BpHYR1_011376 [Brachionus plicatilis]